MLVITAGIKSMPKIRQSDTFNFTVSYSPRWKLYYWRIQFLLRKNTKLRLGAYLDYRNNHQDINFAFKISSYTFSTLVPQHFLYLVPQHMPCNWKLPVQIEGKKSKTTISQWNSEAQINKSFDGWFHASEGLLLRGNTDSHCGLTIRMLK